ncbi:hypothetical protein GP375_004714, partial [Salmonella enterica subsp. enterica serovar Typhimurium]|nr:hypothetical protein [Salmonella enterica subsp. enterica serovar Typhimurium]EDZ8593454.1 hypothetical protein [Salmonella enterica subsp. enterica serovar Typhimurium]
SIQEVAEHVIRHPDVMRQNFRPKTKLCVFLASAMINQNFFLAMRHGWIKKQCPRASIWRLIFAILSGCKLLFLRCLFCLRTGW